QRFPPARYAQLREKMGPMAQYAIGAFIQSLANNPGIEQYLQSLGTKCHVYVGTGIGDITVTQNEALRYERALRRWNEFWSAPERGAALRAHQDGTNVDPNAPRSPSELSIGSEEWIETKYPWEAHWAAKSDALTTYLAEAREIHSEPVPPSAGSGSGSAKLSIIRQKLSKIRALNRRWGCPEEPWAAVSPNLLWNIANIPAAQISMIGKIVGPAFAPVAACASFGVAAKMAMDAILLGEATAVVIGMTDPPPHSMVISAFYNANVLSADADVSRPLTAQHLGMAKGRLYPMALTEGELHADVKVHAARFVQAQGCEVERGYSGKLSMGVGGINSCVISRPWDPEYVRQHVAAEVPAAA